MRCQSSSALATLLLATTAQAFKSTSPFFLLSTTPLNNAALSSSQLALAEGVESKALDALSSCSADLYIVASQPGLSAADFQDATAMPQMRRRVLSGEKTYKSIVQIPEVFGEVDVEKVIAGLEKQCGAERISVEGYYETVKASKAASIMSLQLPALHPGEQARKDGLADADTRLEHILAPIANNTAHVLIYISSPPTSAHYAAEMAEAETYMMDEPAVEQVMHTDLKRAVDDDVLLRRASEEHQKGLPLFERYQFLSPAIFMGLTVSLLLFLILYVGITAIAGLEVSYGAFSKEMGPASQNKNKQQ